jgi:7,8-dihydro-6-hydroxymethylpterin dimethyltransferase
METDKILRNTFSVCPICLHRIPAVHVSREDQIFLEKTCPSHGKFSTVIWRNLRDIDQWRGELPMIAPGENENCPTACGLCGAHQQGTCCVLLEVTKRCNLNCTFCFADGGQGEEISFESICNNLKLLAVPGKTLVQLSGGEPTMRDDLPKIVGYAKEVGCQYVQLNSNGIRLAQDSEYVKKLADAGLSFVFLQFDGTKDEINLKLRGQELFEIKKRAIENCARYNIGVTLVPTIVPELNTHDIGNMIRFAIEHAPAVRGVHFQPVSYFGRIPSVPENHQRFTIDELLQAIEDQAGNLVPKESLLPSRCDHPLCGFHGDYIVMQDQTLVPLHLQKGCSCEIATADQNRDFIATKWQRPKSDNASMDSAETLDSVNDEVDITSLDGFLRRVHSHSFTVTAMAFQDAGNIDLERLRRCSLHVFDHGRMVPFCAYYLSSFSHK